MSNNWGIPDELEEIVRKRDNACVYCGVPFDEKSSTNKATWEHIDNDENNITESNIALCCASCNSRKGAMKLSDWLQSSYCKERNINRETVANVVQEFLKSQI
jgi:5-methylcytosine-specific restriction endonuclease McrA